MAEQPTRDTDFFDFDAWYNEHVDATIPFKLLGETWQIPGDVDARVLMRIQRLEHAVLTGRLPDGFEEELDSLSYDGMIRQMVGDDLCDAWLAKGVPHKMLQAVARRLYAIYKGEDPDEAMGLGKAPEKPVAKTPQARKKKAHGSTSSAGS